jgi:hypothetical protein
MVMGYTIVGLKDKILELHPEIQKNGFNLKVSFEEESRSYELKLSKAGQELGAYLEKKDADDCMDRKKCVNLAVQLTQLIAELEDILSPRKPG